ncbi:MAG: c-type cytochrome [Puniceicoccaceae bacterium]
MKKYIIIAAVAFTLSSFSAFAGADAAKGVWDKQCKKCHAEDGSAKTALGKKLKIKDYTDAASLAEFSDEDLFNMTKDGVKGTKMAGYGKKLSDDEITALVAYMRAMAK